MQEDVFAGEVDLVASENVGHLFAPLVGASDHSHAGGVQDDLPPLAILPVPSLLLHAQDHVTA